MCRVFQPYDRFFFVFHSFKHGMRVLIDEHLNVGLASNHQLEHEWPTPSPQSLTVLCSSFWPSAMEGTGLEELSTSNGTIRELSTSNGTINYTNWRIGKTVDGRISRRMMGYLMIRWGCAALPEICKDVKLVNAATLRSSFWWCPNVLLQILPWKTINTLAVCIPSLVFPTPTFYGGHMCIICMYP